MDVKWKNCRSEGRHSCSVNTFPQHKKKQETRQKERVLTKWAEQCYSSVIHIHGQILKCVCVLQGVFLTLLCEGARRQANRWASHQGGPSLYLSVNSCLLAGRVAVCVCVSH